MLYCLWYVSFWLVSTIIILYKSCNMDVMCVIWQTNGNNLKNVFFMWRMFLTALFGIISKWISIRNIVKACMKMYEKYICWSLLTWHKMMTQNCDMATNMWINQLTVWNKCRNNLYMRNADAVASVCRPSHENICQHVSNLTCYNQWSSLSLTYSVLD